MLSTFFVFHIGRNLVEIKDWRSDTYSLCEVEGTLAL